MNDGLSRVGGPQDICKKVVRLIKCQYRQFEVDLTSCVLRSLLIEQER